MKEEQLNIELQIDKNYREMLDICEKVVLEMKALEKNIQEEEVSELREALDFMLEMRQQVNYQLGLEQPEHEQKGRRLLSILKGALFYATLVLVVLGVGFFRGNNDGIPNNIAGYSFMTVLSGSMQRDIPRGALIITQQVDPQTIEIGDDITYITQAGMTVTHRVIGIDENLGGSRRRGFQTQGIENPFPDEEIVYAPNVIGRVIFVNLIMGQIIQFLQQSIIFVLVFIFLLVCFMEVSKRYFRAAKLKSRYEEG